MRHGKTFNHLGRTSSHRKAMLSNMASSLILHKRISTTLAKAKELRKFTEPLLTKSKNDTTHSRRTVFSYLKDKDAVKELFDNVAQKIADRPGGYTRIIKLGNRLGDAAEICLIELVDYNETLLKDSTEVKKTRRSRRGSGSGKANTTVETTSTQPVESVEASNNEVISDAVVVEDDKPIEEVSKTSDEIKDEEK